MERDTEQNSPQHSDTEQTSAQPRQDEELVAKRGGTSVVWSWFGYKKSDTDQKTVLCKVCRRPVPTSDSNTTNLFYHLEKNHKRQYRESQKMRATWKASVESKSKPQTTLKESFARGTPYHKTSRRHKEITSAITTFICKDMAPIYTVEKKGFRELVKTLDPKYIMPSRKHFSDIELPRLYGECRAKVEEELRRVSYYATTTDLWTSRTTQPYMSLTIHFIKEDWTLCSRCLQTSYFPDDHTGVMIANGLREALQSWGLSEDHLVCVTTDNATNNISALELNDWTRLQCFGHRLQLAIGECLTQCKTTFQC